jgi:hypothetical protein
MRHRGFLVRAAIALVLSVCMPVVAAAGFRETRNAAGLYLYHLSGAQTRFYEALASQAGYEGTPTWAYGARVRTYSSREVGLDLSVLYTDSKGDQARVSSVLIQAGPMLPIPLAGESKVVIPYGSAGLTLLRTAFDVESQLDFGFHVKLGVEVAVLKVVGICLEGQYTIVTVRNREDHGIYDYLDKSYSFGDAAWNIGIHYYP